MSFGFNPLSKILAEELSEVVITLFHTPYLFRWCKVTDNLFIKKLDSGLDYPDVIQMNYPIIFGDIKKKL